MNLSSIFQIILQSSQHGMTVFNLESPWMAGQLGHDDNLCGGKSV